MLAIIKSWSIGKDIQTMLTTFFMIYPVYAHPGDADYLPCTNFPATSFLPIVLAVDFFEIGFIFGFFGILIL